MIRPKKLPRDFNQRAHQIAGLLTGEVEIPAEPERTQLSTYLSVIGRKGGLKGGLARAKKLSKRKRQAIGKKAARARWSKHK
jgi:hypothetical protein